MRRHLPCSTFARTARRTTALIATAAIAAPLVLAVSSSSASAVSQSVRVAASKTVESRTIELLVNDATGDVSARVTGAVLGDEVWLDRSVNGFDTWDGPLGINDEATVDTLTSDPATDLNDRVGDDIALFRACVRIEIPENDELVECTEGSRSRTGDALAAADGMSEYYNPTSKIFDRDPTGIQPVKEDGSPWWIKWWHSGVATSALVNTSVVTDEDSYLNLVDSIYEGNKNLDLDGLGNNFRNDFIDDTGWWAMAWVDAYRATGDQKYLETAKVAADFMSQWWNTKTECGGLYWQLHRPNGYWEGKDHLSAISNGLYLQVNAALFQETGQSQYLERAEQEWDWYSNSGMIDSDGLVLDGVNQNTCKTHGQKFTYNQGVLISGLVELFHATGDESLLETAQTVADAMTSPLMSKNGILRDTCEATRYAQVNNNDNFGYRCKNDGPTFKGPAIRGLSELNAVLAERPYTEYLGRQLDNARSVGSLQGNIRQGADLYGLRWFDRNSEFPQADQDTDAANANQLHVGNQVAGLMLANANAAASTPAAATVSLTTTPAAPTATGWYQTAVTATALSTPATTIKQSLGSGWHPYAGPQIFHDGEHLMTVAVPRSNRVATRWIRVDSVAPTLTATIPEFQRVVTLSASDATSGLDRIEYRLGSGSWQRYSTTVTVPLTQPSISYRAFDVAGNVSATQTHAFGPQLGSRIQVSVSNTAVGERAVLSARVRPADARYTNDPAAIPTETIQVFRDGRIIASGTLRSGQAKLSLPRDFKVGAHSVQVLYTGSGVFHSTSTSATLRVVKASATANVKAKKKVKRSKRLKVTTTVRTTTGIQAKGKVRVQVFRGKKRVLQRTGKLNTKGKSGIKLPRIKKAGKYTLRVIYRGNADTSQSKMVQSTFRVVR